MAELPVKLEDIQDKIRERIKAAFMDLIPEEKWDEIIKREVDYLMLDGTKETGYGRTEIVPSPLREMVQGLIKEKFDKKLEEWAADKLNLVIGTPEFDKMFGEYVSNAAKVFMGHLSQQIVGQALQAFAGQMRQCSGCSSMGFPGSRCSCGNFI